MSQEVNTDKEKAIQILEYWFLVELLNQESLGTFEEKGNKASEYKKELMARKIRNPKKVVENFVQISAGDDLQTVLDSLPEQLKDFHTSDFTVFIGCMKKETCIQEIARNVQWSSQNPDAKDANNDEITLAILKFAKNGRYISNSLSISPLAWAMKKLSCGTENTSQTLSTDNYNSDTRNIETQIVNLFNASGNGDVASEETDSLQVLDIVSYDVLIMVENLICEGLNIEDKDMESYLAVYFKLYESEDDDENGAEVSLHMDFYSKDLAFVIDGLRNHRFTKEKEKMLLDYILGLNRYESDPENT